MHLSVCRMCPGAVPSDFTHRKCWLSQATSINPIYVPVRINIYQSHSCPCQNRHLSIPFMLLSESTSINPIHVAVTINIHQSHSCPCPNQHLSIPFMLLSESTSINPIHVAVRINIYQSHSCCCQNQHSSIPFMSENPPVDMYFYHVRSVRKFCCNALLSELPGLALDKDSVINLNG